LSSDAIESLERRKVLTSAGIVAAIATVSPTLAFGDSQHDHHGKAQVNQNIVDAALNCIKSGQACIDHCIELFKIGDTSVAQCADKVQEMLAMCTALSQFASYQSKYLHSLAKVCIDVCGDCAAECRKHAEKHAECKACMNSCEECIEECKKLTA
jgi:Cys-rich four helix bundle protein (predicted Tat secretion target)